MEMMPNREWEEEDGILKLIFSPYGDKEELARVYKDENGSLVITSAMLNMSEEYLEICMDADETKDRANIMREVEGMVRQHYEDMKNYYSELLRLFDE